MEYDFDEMARQWNGIRDAYRAFRGAGSEKSKHRFHQNLIKQLDYFFTKYPNPFGDDPSFNRLEISEGVTDSSEKADARARLEKATALLADIDATIQHNRRSGANPQLLNNLRTRRKEVVLKMEQINKEM